MLSMTSRAGGGLGDGRLRGDDTAPDDPRLTLWRLGSIVALAALLRLSGLANQSLWFDEGTSLNMSDGGSLVQSFLRVWGLNTGGERFQPLYNVVLTAWRASFGDGEWALRSLSALASIGAVVLVFLTARRVFGLAHATWSGIVAACSSFAIFYAQEARPYALLMLLTAAETYCLSPVLLGVRRGEGSRWWITLHSAVVAVGAWGSIFFLLFSAALAAAQLVSFRSPSTWARWWLPAAAGATPALAFYLAGGHAADPAHAIVVTRYGYPVVESVAFVLYGVFAGLTYGPSVVALHGSGRWAEVRAHGLELAVLGVVAIGIALALGRVLSGREGAVRRSRQASAVLVLAAGFALVLALIFAVLTRVTWLPRHSYFLWIPLVLVLPAIRGAGQSAGRIGAVLIVSFLAVNLYSLGKHYFRYDYSKEDYRGVARYVSEQNASGAPSVLVYGHPRLLRYYGDARTSDMTRTPPDQLAGRVRDVTRGASPVLVVLAQKEYWQSRTGGSIGSLMGDVYVIESTVAFQNVTVYRMALREVPSPPRQTRVSPL